VTRGEGRKGARLETVVANSLDEGAVPLHELPLWHQVNHGLPLARRDNCARGETTCDEIRQTKPDETRRDAAQSVAYKEENIRTTMWYVVCAPTSIQNGALYTLDAFQSNAAARSHRGVEESCAPLARVEDAKRRMRCMRHVVCGMCAPTSIQNDAFHSSGVFQSKPMAMSH
jgi:hypothetical protein